MPNRSKREDRFKNWVTTIIGALMMALALVMYVLNHFYKFEIPVLEIVMVVILGWVFLSARDTLLEGLFFNLFRLKKDEPKDNCEKDS
jgi:predicted membrane channel-forming protein YqfA (hemolysin III family)